VFLKYEKGKMPGVGNLKKESSPKETREMGFGGTPTQKVPRAAAF